MKGGHTEKPGATAGRTPSSGSRAMLRAAAVLKAEFGRFAPNTRLIRIGSPLCAVDWLSLQTSLNGHAGGKHRTVPELCQDAGTCSQRACRLTNHAALKRGT